MYDLSNSYNNAFSVVSYTVNAMRATGFTQEDIYDYLDEATKSNNANLINVSIEYVDKCNNRSRSYFTPYDDVDFMTSYMNEYCKLNGLDVDDDFSDYEGFTSPTDDDDDDIFIKF